MLALAGIYDWWLDPTKKPDDPSRWLLSFAILTKDAAEPLAPIHERNPILLSSSSLAEWLDPDNLEDPENTTQDLLNELANESDEIAGRVEFWEVSADAGNVRNNSPALIQVRAS
jgi:putative SOS response-associated peptidase YedK